ncbi:hypothetical protein CMO84_11095 [Candidatus Woesearchaeota archaeon]|jgi:phosphate-selective porin OprO/OprP|nr:hypothetical protein [Candidatus Woesearchaeota archaeon]
MDKGWAYGLTEANRIRIESSSMFLVASIALSFVAQEPPSEPEGSFFYRDGLWAEGREGLSRVRLKGRWMHDWGDLDPNWRDDPAELDQTRRLRLLLQGEWNPQLAFKTQGELKGGDPSLLEWWLEWRTPTRPAVRFGHFREPFGLDARTSSAHLTFVERASPTQALTFGRNRGMDIHKPGVPFSWEAGVFRESVGMADEGLLNNKAITGRLIWLPLGDVEGEEVLHFGLSASYRDTQADGVRLSADPEVHLARNGVDTGMIAADSTSGLALEGAWQRKAFTMQAELLFANLVRADGADAALRGGYLQASRILTGERRNYRNSTHSMGRLPVAQPTLGGGGPGAWELGVRYSQTDLRDGYVDGGVMDNLTLGLTWHLNSDTRWMVNHVQTSSDGDRAGLLLVRLHSGF